MALSDKMKTEIAHSVTLDEDRILAELGRELQSIDTDLIGAEALSAAIPRGPAPDSSKTMGPLKDTFKRFGEEFLKRFQKAIYGLICDEKNPSNKQIKDSVGAGAAAVGAALAATLTAWFAWLPGIVIFVAAYVAKQIVEIGFESACATFAPKTT